MRVKDATGLGRFPSPNSAKVSRGSDKGRLGLIMGGKGLVNGDRRRQKIRMIGGPGVSRGNGGK